MGAALEGRTVEPGTVRVYTLRAIERLAQVAYLAMLVLVVLQGLPERALHRLKRLHPLFRRPCDQEYFRLLRGVQNLLLLLPLRIPWLQTG